MSFWELEQQEVGDRSQDKGVLTLRRGQTLLISRNTSPRLSVVVIESASFFLWGQTNVHQKRARSNIPILAHARPVGPFINCFQSGAQLMI